MCYQESLLCWGGEWPVIVDGTLKSACSAHRHALVKLPVLRIEMQNDIISDYDELNHYLLPFVKEEIGDVPGAGIYGHGGAFAKVSASIFATENDMKKVSGDTPFTHFFIVWDFDDEAIFDRLDRLLMTDVVVQSVTI